MNDAGLWTLDELSAQVAAALAVDYDGAGNGRVRDVPDRRTIRWYTTNGLVDRPAAMRGRVALYDRRHLTQLVAIKRLQAQGLSLAQIQRELAGATTRTLERIARLPADVRAAAPVRERARDPEAARPRFWAAVPDEAAPAATAASTLATTATAATSDARAVYVTGQAGDADEDMPAGDAAAALVPAVRLAPGATLLLHRSGRMPGPAELAAIRAAATPLLDLLRRLGLDDTSGREELP